MSIQSAQSVTVLFTTRVFATGVGTNADSLPTGSIYVNGTVNAASVTVTNISTGLYKAAVTLPTLAIGDEVEMIIAATVSSIADTAVIWGDVKDFLADASGFGTANLNGDLTATMKASAATAVWTDTTASDFTTSASIGKSVMNGVALGTGLTINVLTTNSDKTGYALSQTFPTNFSALSIDSGGVAKANLAQILGTALTETSGQIAAAFKKFFNIATPAATMDHLVLVDTVTTATTTTNLTNVPTTAMTESYAAQGAAMTLPQAIYQIVQILGQNGVAGTTMTVKKRDGATTAKTFTLNDATNPTSIVEAT